MLTVLAQLRMRGMAITKTKTKGQQDGQASPVGISSRLTHANMLCVFPVLPMRTCCAGISITMTLSILAGSICRYLTGGNVFPTNCVSGSRKLDRSSTNRYMMAICVYMWPILICWNVHVVLVCWNAAIHIWDCGFCCCVFYAFL